MLSGNRFSFDDFRILNCCTVGRLPVPRKGSLHSGIGFGCQACQCAHSADLFTLVGVNPKAGANFNGNSI